MKVKKILLTLCIITAGIINYTKGALIQPMQGGTQYGNNYFYTTQNSDIKMSETPTSEEYNIYYNKASYEIYESQTAFFWYDNKLYYMGVRNNEIWRIGYLNNYCLDTFSGNNCYYCRSDNYGDCWNGTNSSLYNKPSELFYNDPKYKGKLTDIIVELRVTNVGGNSVICFRYEDLNETICFGAGNKNGTDISGLTPDNIFQDDTFIGIMDIEKYKNYFQKSPFNVTQTNKICQPIQFQIDLYGRNYNTGLCYSNEQIITGGQVINETPISIFEAFQTYEDYRNGYNLIGNYCHTEQGNTYEECQTALQNIGKKPGQILFKTIQAELPTNKVYQYCHLQLDFTEEEKRNIGRCQLTDEEKYATGVNQETSNPNILEGYEDMLLQSNTDILIPGEGTVFDEILPDGVITRKNLVTNFDFIGDLMSLMTKISAIFIVRPNVEGIIPPVILSLLLLIILFKVFRK